MPGSGCGAVHLVLSVENEEDVQNTGQTRVGAVAAVSPVAHKHNHVSEFLSALSPRDRKAMPSIASMPLCSSATVTGMPMTQRLEKGFARSRAGRKTSSRGSVSMPAHGEVLTWSPACRGNSLRRSCWWRGPQGSGQPCAGMPQPQWLGPGTARHNSDGTSFGGRDSWHVPLCSCVSGPNAAQL